MTSETIVKISVEKLARLKLDLYAGNPFKFRIPMTQAEVRREMLRQVNTGERFSGMNWNTRAAHVARVATLAITGWAEPITIKLGVSSGDWPITDGNHRLAAALLRGDMFILALVLRGDEQFVRKILCPPRGYWRRNPTGGTISVPTDRVLFWPASR